MIINGFYVVWSYEFSVLPVEEAKKYGIGMGQLNHIINGVNFNQFL